MQRAQIPIKYPIPWANNAGVDYIRPVPVASQIGVHDGYASLTDGFPPLNFQPVASGGIPPFGQDANGIFNQVTSWQQWLQAGMSIIQFDTAFQTSIGGYPNGAWVGSVATPGAIWQSNADSNMTNPDTGGANWSAITLVDPAHSALILRGNTAQGANLALYGNGTTTPNKYLRAVNAEFSIVNNAYSAEIFTLSDQGDISNIRNLTGSGNASFTGSIAAGAGLRAGNFFSPNSYASNEWNFTTDASGNKFETFRGGGWYNYWNSSDGSRHWDAPGQELMVLSGAGALTVTGMVTAGGNGFYTTANLTASNGVFTGDGALSMYQSANGVRFMQFILGFSLQLLPPAVSGFDWTYDIQRYGATWTQWRGTDMTFFNALAAVGGAGPYFQVSDASAKSGIEHETRGLSHVLQLSPKSFTRPRGGRAQEAAPLFGKEVGFIAQEVQEIIPEAVATLARTDAEPLLVMTLDPIVAMLVNGMKEIVDRLDALEAAK